MASRPAQQRRAAFPIKLHFLLHLPMHGREYGRIHHPLLQIGARWLPTEQVRVSVVAGREGNRRACTNSPTTRSTYSKSGVAATDGGCSAPPDGGRPLPAVLHHQGRSHRGGWIRLHVATPWRMPAWQRVRQHGGMSGRGARLPSNLHHWFVLHFSTIVSSPAT